MEINRQRMRINPAQLGATSCQDMPDCWLLSNSGRQEMTIACMDPDNEMFTVTLKIAKLLPEAQAYQLAAAMMLNREPGSLNGGAVAYEVDDDSFLYCKWIDARTLSLASFGCQINEAFATAHKLRELLLHAQKEVGPSAPPAKAFSTMSLLSRRRPL